MADQATTAGGVRALRSRWARLLAVVAVIGPGIITANVDNDAGGIATYSQAGAAFGYSLLWTLIPITVALIVVQEMCARMGVVTGKGLSDLIRERFGVKATFYVMLALVIANLGNTMAEFAGVAEALEIFGVSRYLSVPLVAFTVWLLVLKGSARVVERIFLAACVFYVPACGATIFKAGGTIETAGDAAVALKPLAGRWASALFAFGLFNASLFAASVLPLSTSYYVCEAFGWESGIDRRREDAPQFYFLYEAMIVLGAGLVLLPGLPLLRIMLLSQTANGVLLPFILIFMLLLAGDERLMGRYRNGPARSAFARAN